MKGMILAAGFGTRLRPVTYTLPKPMVPLINLPLVAWAVESYLRAGVNDIVVNLHHLPEPIERYLRDTYGHDASFHFSYEQEILGTGGGIRRVRPQLSGGDFFLVNGDTVQFPRYGALRDARQQFDAVAALTMRHAPEGDRFTAVYLDEGRVTGFGKGTGEALMFAGSHCISDRVFDHLPDTEFSGIVDGTYQPLLESGREVIAGIVDDGLWFDIGTPQRYLSASRALLEATVRQEVPLARGSHVRGDSVLHETARSSRVTRTSIGARSIVQGEVTDCAIWEDCVIGAGVKLERCIVGHGVELRGDIEAKDQMITVDNGGLVWSAVA